MKIKHITGAFLEFNIGSEGNIHVQHLHVPVAFRRRGIATEMMDTLKGYSLNSFKLMIWLECSVNNPIAIKFYEHYGFKNVGYSGCDEWYEFNLEITK